MDDGTVTRAAFGPFPFQLPPERSFVSLSHAVSWIALQHSVASPALSVLLGIGTQRGRGEVNHDEQMDTAIAIAVERLTDLASGGAITMRGRFFRDVLDNEIKILTRRIPPVRLADYRWFDTLDDALYRGLGIAWAKDRRELLYPSGDDGHYRIVTVNRADLMLEFPPEKAEPQVDVQSAIPTRAPAVKNGRLPDDAFILAKADEMKERGLCGREIAANIRLEPGFEHVGTVHVRELIKGRYFVGRPKKVAQ